MTASALTAAGPDQDFIEGITTFLDREVRPLEAAHAQELERTGTIDPAVQLAARRQLRRRSAAAGFYSAAMPVEVGGGGLDPVTVAHAYRAIGASGLLLADRGGVLPNVEGPMTAMVAFSPYQREHYLAPLMNADLEGCFAITESDAGSDATRLRTTARQEGDEWVINGSKQFITHGAYADFVQVVAETDPDAAPARRHTVFIVDCDAPGFSVGSTHHTLGEDRPVDLHFDSVRVHESAIIGERGRAIRYAMDGIGRARVNISALAIGKSEYLVGHMVDYASHRVAFGRAIGAFQHVQAHIVDSSIEVDAALGLMERAALAADGDDSEARRLAASLKVYATETLSRTADRAIQVLGGVGVTHAGGVERYYRDARAMRIYEGTSELLRSNIAGWLGLPR